MTVPSSEVECGGPAPPPPPPPTGSATSSPSMSVRHAKPGAADSSLLLADIRNGVSLKPTKTKDKSTPAFIKQSRGANKSPSPPPAQLNGSNGNVSIVEMKDALQHELRNTLKRKVKTQDVERGDCTKKDEIEKSMEINRTEVQLKVNTTAQTPPMIMKKDTVDMVSMKNGELQSDPSKTEKPQNEPTRKPETVVNDSTLSVENHTKNSPVLQRAPAKPARATQSQVSKPITTVSAKQTVSIQPEIQQNGSIESPTAANGITPSVKKLSEAFQSSVSSKSVGVTKNKVADSPKSTVSQPSGIQKKSAKEHNPVKVEIKPFESPRTPLNGTLRKVSPQKALTIDVTVGQDDRLKNSILSPDVKSGNAAIRPSQIKSLTQQGSHISHTDILENPKPISKSPISLVESPAYVYSPPPPKSTSPASTGLSSPRTHTRTTILDTKFTNGVSKTSPTLPGVDPQKKLMMTHPKASFTLSRNAFSGTPKGTEPKPVFRILTDLEQAERTEADQEQIIPPKQQVKKDTPKADEPGAEPVLTSYVSFAKELTNSPNNYPDTVTKHTTVGVVKQDLFFDSMNLRDIKIDIIEGGGELKVVKK